MSDFDQTKKRVKPNRKVQSLLANKTERRTGTVSGILSAMFAKIASATIGTNQSADGRLHWNTARWEYFMAKYLHDPRNAIPQNRSDLSTERSNLNDALNNKNMSWKIFCRGLRFLRIESFTITIDTKHGNGEKTVYSMPVDLGIETNDDNNDEE